MANLDYAINWILRTHGHDILLQRRDPSGVEFQNRLEKHTVRHMYPNTRGLAGILQYQPEGRVHVVDMIYFFLPNARPKEGDRIYERDPRFSDHVADGGKFNDGQTLWLLDYALPMRGRNGKIVFYAAGVTRESPN